ncbi:MAG: LysM peptidoglycan-binding domain-containing M23 family metallopeptidase [Deltaproteobacteria bacterium]
MNQLIETETEQNKRKHLILCLLLLILTLFGAESLAQDNGVYHLVRSGEDIAIIANSYKIPRQIIIKANRLRAPYTLENDTVLFIPGVARVVEIAPQATRKEVKKIATTETKTRKPSFANKQFANTTKNAVKQTSDTPATNKQIANKTKSSAVKKTATNQHSKSVVSAPPASGKFIMPVTGKIIHHFGYQPNGMFFNGIKIVANKKELIKATNNGVVIFAGNIKEYGNTVILKHADNFASVYTNLAKTEVKLKQKLRKGEKLGSVGECKIKEDCYITFELRKNNKAIDPIKFLQ